MLKQARRGSVAPRRRSAPSLARTMQTLRRMRGRGSRISLETRVIAIRNQKQLV